MARRALKSLSLAALQDCPAVHFAGIGHDLAGVICTPDERLANPWSTLHGGAYIFLQLQAAWSSILDSDTSRVLWPASITTNFYREGRLGSRVKTRLDDDRMVGANDVKTFLWEDNGSGRVLGTASLRFSKMNPAGVLWGQDRWGEDLAPADPEAAELFALYDVFAATPIYKALNIVCRPVKDGLVATLNGWHPALALEDRWVHPGMLAMLFDLTGDTIATRFDYRQVEARVTQSTLNFLQPVYFGSRVVAVSKILAITESARLPEIHLLVELFTPEQGKVAYGTQWLKLISRGR